MNLIKTRLTSLKTLTKEYVAKYASSTCPFDNYRFSKKLESIQKRVEELSLQLNPLVIDSEATRLIDSIRSVCFSETIRTSKYLSIEYVHRYKKGKVARMNKLVINLKTMSAYIENDQKQTWTIMRQFDERTLVNVYEFPFIKMKYLDILESALERLGVGVQFIEYKGNLDNYELYEADIDDELREIIANTIHLKLDKVE